MSDKAAKKKQYILDTARGVFAKKGYKDVTMKDIVEACDISRGGLYIYFDSTESILLSCLEGMKQDEDILKGRSAGDALAMFLNEQKKAILNKENDLTVAVYEYLFSKHFSGEPDTLIKPGADAVIKVLSKVLEAGAENGELYCEDCELAARNIMYTVEGLKLAANTYGITEKEIDMQLLYILSGLITEE